MAERSTTGKATLTREGLFLLLALVFGLLVLPFLVYTVGQFIFSDFAGGDFKAFFAEIHDLLKRGNLYVWFLVLSPYLVLQTLRMSLRLFRLSP